MPKTTQACGHPNVHVSLFWFSTAKRNNATRQSYLTACHVAAGSNGPWQKESGIRAAMRNKAACRKYVCGQGKDANMLTYHSLSGLLYSYLACFAF